MSIEHVEDLLSAYLDNALTQEEQAQVATHLHTCVACSTVLADFRRFDALLAKQPRVSPGVALHERIFSSPEYLQLIGDMPRQFIYSNPSANSVGSGQAVPQKRVRLDDASRPRLVSIPGKGASRSEQETKARIRVPQRQNMHIQRFMQILIAACLLLTLGVGSFIGWNLWQEQGKTAHNTSPGITPPQALHQGRLLSAGMRFVFLHDGSLWSAPEDGSTQAVRLTPPTVVVAPHWLVSPPSSNHVAGNLLAYVDMKHGYIHIIRSDGQSDTSIKQPLLQNTSEASWNTATGSAILNSLSWSPDGHILAFIAGPTETSTLFLYSISTTQIQTIVLPDKGSVSHLVWSPNGVRIVFSFTHDAVTSVLDYNVVTREVLTVAPVVATLHNPSDTVLTLDWVPSNAEPAITWSIGTQGHIHSIWLRHVGDANGADGVQPLSSGEYTQAVYSRSGEQGLGGWLLVRTLTANTDTVLTLTLTGKFSPVVNGSQIDVVQWTSDGKHITYFDSFVSGIGTLHSIDMTNNRNMLIARTVYSNIAPVWSSDQRYLLYSTGTGSFVTDVENGKTQIAVHSTASALVWSATSSSVVIVTTRRDIHIADIYKNTAKILSIEDVTGPIMWTQIP